MKGERSNDRVGCQCHEYTGWCCNRLSVCLFTDPSTCLSVFLSVYLFIPFSVCVHYFVVLTFLSFLSFFPSFFLFILSIIHYFYILFFFPHISIIIHRRIVSGRKRKPVGGRGSPLELQEGATQRSFPGMRKCKQSNKRTQLLMGKPGSVASRVTRSCAILWWWGRYGDSHPGRSIGKNLLSQDTTSAALLFGGPTGNLCAWVYN